MSKKADAAWAFMLLVPIVFGGGWSLVRLGLEGGDVPTLENYAAIGQAIEAADFDPAQDRVAILPAWSLRPLVELKRFPWVSADGLAQRPLHRIRHLFVVLEPDGEDAYSRLENKWGWSKVLASAGPVQLLKLETGARTVVDDLAARIETAEVQLVKGKAVTACDQKKQPQGLGCKGRKHWQRVTREHLLVTENGDQALWVHPPVRGERLEIKWPKARMGEVLILRSGFLRTGANWAKAPVRIRVRIADQEIAKLLRPVAFDFGTTRIDTSAFAGTEQPLSLWIDSRDNGKAHFALDVFTANPKASAAAGDKRAGAP